MNNTWKWIITIIGVTFGFVKILDTFEFYGCNSISDFILYTTFNIFLMLGGLVSIIYSIWMIWDRRIDIWKKWVILGAYVLCLLWLTGIILIKFIKYY